MRVAVCISGQTRCLEQTYPALVDSIISPNEADVFMHTWDDSAWEGRSKNYCEMVDYLEDIDRGPGMFHCQTEKFQMGSNPWNPLDTDVSERRSIIPMYYSIWKSNQIKRYVESLLESKYDLVLRVRTDVVFEGDLLHDEVDVVLEHPHGGLFVGWPGIDCGYKSCRNNMMNEEGVNVPLVSDMFAFGDSASMDLYADTYNNIVSFGRYCRNDWGVNLTGIIPASEVCLGYQLRAANIAPHRTGLRMQMVVKHPQGLALQSWYPEVMR